MVMLQCFEGPDFTCTGMVVCAIFNELQECPGGEVILDMSSTARPSVEPLGGGTTQGVSLEVRNDAAAFNAGTCFKGQ